MDQGRARGYRHYLYGGAPGTAELLAAKMKERFPGLQIVGLASPPFRPLSNAEDAAAVAAINETHADCVWVGLGAPKQDVWVAEHRERLSCALVLAVGAAFDFHAGRKPRAPQWMQRSGTEWIFRFLTEPRRLGPRYLVTSVKFAGLLAAVAVRLLLRRQAPPDSRRTG
jgi:N-acetylglucosaminyldiphosphoundecaprenol N-acetyl-beta-D-mannosaminyltransferase